MLRRLAAGAALFATIVTCHSAVAIAQDTRTATLEQERAEKAARLELYQPGRLERALLYLEREQPLRRLAPHNGFFVRYGYHAKPTGSGLGIGGGFRHDLLDERARIVLEAGTTLRGYRLLRADFSLPQLAGGLLELGVEASDHHNPQEDFFGPGATSLAADRVNFLLDQRTVQARVVAKPAKGLQLGARAGRIAVSIGAGTDKRFPSLESRFGDAEAPGLLVQPDYTYADLFAVLDRRDQPGNARAGGFYGITSRHYTDADLDRYGFRGLDIDVQQFFPVFDKKRVIAIRGLMTTTSTDAGQVVPFYLRPTVGGGTTLRSVSDFRFRDANALVLNAEYRWEAFSGLDMALFSDWGQVAPEARDLSLSEMKRGYGLGFRFNTYKAVFLRIDIATGAGEGIRYFMKFNKAF